MSLRKWEEEPAVMQLLQDLRQNRMSHAYLFLGSDLEKKKEVAGAFAQGLLCYNLEAGEPCGVCLSCEAFGRSSHPDFHPLEVRGNSLKIDQIRNWRSLFGYHPFLGRYQVFLLLFPERMTLPAANSLLKALEEPIPQTVFLLITEDDRLPVPTVVSRCRLCVFRGCRRSPSKEKAEGFDQIYQLLWEEKQSALLRAVRLFGQDRSAAQDLLKFMFDRLEEVYREQKNRVPDTAGLKKVLLDLAECLGTLLRGIILLEENIQVPLLLTLTLREVQRRLHSSIYL